jgi:cold shock CspA family protein
MRKRRFWPVGNPVFSNSSRSSSLVKIELCNRAAKAYGYIRRDRNLPDLLVTLPAVERAGMATLTKGQRLRFDGLYDNKTEQTCAENVSKVLDPCVDGY